MLLNNDRMTGEVVLLFEEFIDTAIFFVEYHLRVYWKENKILFYMKRG
jgi:hypothetical protein